MQKTILIAHRGFSSIALENTLPAFRLAAKANYTAIETDIQVTKDGVFVIHHDEDLSRIYGQNLLIAEENYDTLLQASMVHGLAYRLATLKEYLAICRKHHITAVVELKVLFSEIQIEKLLHLIKKDLPNIVFISFFPENLSLLRKLKYRGPMQILSFQPIDSTLFEQSKTLNAAVDIHHNLATLDVIQKFHEIGTLVNVWTVDDKEKAMTLMNHGVDFITTNGLLSSDFAAS